MPVPIIIAAHNEERLIKRCLTALPSDFEPYVAANGCKDRTVSVAQSFGAKVISLEAAGKLPAIQETLKTIGRRALEPVLYLDADSYPLFPLSWEKEMMTAVSQHGNTPQSASGPLGYFDGNPISDVVRTGKRFVDVRMALKNGHTLFWGSNMATNFDQSTLDEVLNLPHIWPGEDRAIEMKIQESNGITSQVIHPRATVMTSSRYMLPLTHIFTSGRDVARQETLADYNRRAAAGSIPLGKYMRQLRIQRK